MKPLFSKHSALKTPLYTKNSYFLQKVSYKKVFSIKRDLFFACQKGHNKNVAIDSKYTARMVTERFPGRGGGGEGKQRERGSPNF